MPRRKKQAEATDKPAADAASAESGNGKATVQRGAKYQALREALQELGPKAKNSDLADHIRSHRGPEAIPANISVAKSNILKKLKQDKARARKAAAAEARPVTRAPSRASDAISVDDLRQIKELTERLGKDRLKEMADLVS